MERTFCRAWADYAQRRIYDGVAGAEDASIEDLASIEILRESWFDQGLFSSPE